MNDECICPECGIGHLQDTGSMFAAEFECSNPKCNYSTVDITGCINADIDD